MNVKNILNIFIGSAMINETDEKKDFFMYGRTEDTKNCTKTYIVHIYNLRVLCALILYIHVESDRVSLWLLKIFRDKLNE